MIEPMKRYSFFVYQPEYQQFILHLRALGVVQIKERTNPKEVDAFAHNLAIQEEIKQLQLKLSKVVSSHPLPEGKTREQIDHSPLPEGVLTDYNLFSSTVTQVEEQITFHESKIAEVKSQQKELEVWGNFDPALIEKLRASGYYLHFWLVPPAKYDEEWEQVYNAQVINSVARYIYFVTVTKSEVPPHLSGAEFQKLPKESLGQLRQKEQELQKNKELLEGSINYLAYHPEILAEQLIALRNDYNLSNATLQSVRMYDDQLAIVEGWIPAKLSKGLEQDLQASDVAYTELPIEDVTKVPIKLRNNRFTKAFEPLVKLFSLPNYGELDPTPFIAPFFMVFFGICFGDAGYGLFVLLLATFLKRKAKESSKIILELIQWLGLAGLVIGFFSGSFFGVQLVEIPFLASIKQYFISSDNMMIISLAIGLVQILFAKYIGAVKKTRQVGVKNALSAYAWPTLIIMLLVLVGLPMLQITLPKWLTYLLYGVVGLSVLIVLFYNSPGKSLLYNFGSGLWDTYNAASGLLGDTLSYIRLFAIGLTGAVLGQVFNQLAAMVSSGLPIIAAIPVGAIILIIGHSINFGLTAIGALVHPIRLIFVEYFNNSEYEGGGKPYTPLSKLEVEK